MKQNIIILFLIISFSNYAHSNAIGSDAQNFNPTTSGLDFVTVQSSETLDPGVFNFGLFLNYAINTLPYFPSSGSGSNQSRTDFNDSFFAVDYNFGLGLMENWDVGVSFPNLISQSVDNTNNVGLYSNGLTEIRVNSKYRLSGDEDGGWAVVGTVNFNRIKNNPFAGQDAGPTTNLELAWDTLLSGWTVGANLGYRFRDQGLPITGLSIDPVPDQWVASAAASYLVKKWDTKLIFEIFSSIADRGAGINQTNRELSSAEFLAGAKYDLKHDLAAHVGMGTELIHGASSPDWRLYAGLNWNYGPLWKEKGIRVERKKPYDKINLPEINFEFASSELTADSKVLLREAVASIKQIYSIRKIKRITVGGHTDSVGSAESNLGLSQKRAKAVANFIISEMPIDASKVRHKGYGESQPVASNNNYQGRSKNRRVELDITKY